MNPSKSLTVAKLQTTPVLIFEGVLELYNLYTCHIRPFISEAFKLKHSAAWTKTTLFIKEDKKWFLVNNFELFHLIKSPDVDFNVLGQKVSVRYIPKDQFNFDISFYELINLIAQHNKTIDIRLVYSQLNQILDQEINQKLFGKNIFANHTLRYGLNYFDRQVAYGDLFRPHIDLSSKPASDVRCYNPDLLRRGNQQVAQVLFHAVGYLGGGPESQNFLIGLVVSNKATVLHRHGGQTWGVPSTPHNLVSLGKGSVRVTPPSPKLYDHVGIRVLMQQR